MNASAQTPLEQILVKEITAGGPLTIARYMDICLSHPEHGYYMSRDPFGRGGDFITAPEVSQMFGEAIGVWFATAWQMMGLPKPVKLIELGPGRGTLMADIMRAIRILPPLREAAEVHLVEISPVLKETQKQTLARDGITAQWHDSFEDVPDGPAMIIANEFFDAIPIHQFVRGDDGWHERVVGLDEQEKLSLGLASDLFPDSAIPQWATETETGGLIELSPARQRIAASIAERLASQGGAGLIIDYGHARSFAGDTFQAVHKHKFVDVLHLPGESDLTSHVDFEALAKDFADAGAAVHRPRTQRDFLFAMGLREREAMLKKKAPARVRINLSKQAERLVSEKQMGNLFKVLAVTHPSLGTPHPFGEPG